LIVVDASVLLAAEDLDDVNHDASVALLETGALGTLELVVYEVTEVAEIRWRDPEAGRRLRERVWAISEFGAMVRMDRALGERTAELSCEHALNAYDAAYVAAAERLGAPLASCDQRDLVTRGLAKLPEELLASRPGPTDQ